jgi:signal transduction histidine kinase
MSRTYGEQRPANSAVEAGGPATTLADLIGRARLIRDLDEAADLVASLAGLPGVERLALVPRGASVPAIPPGSSAWPLGNGANASVLIAEVDQAAPAPVRQRVDAFATALDLALRRAPQRRAGDRPGGDAAQHARALRAVLTCAPALVLVVRPNRTWSAETALTARLLDGLSAELAADGPSALVHPSDRALAATIFRSALAGQEPPGPVQLRLRTPDRQWMGCDVVVRNLLADPDVHGVVWYAAAPPEPGPPTAADLRRVVSTYDAVPEELVRAATHLVRTPLTAVISFADLLADDPDLRAGHRELVQAVQRNADRLRVVSDDLLLLIQMSSGAMPLHLVPLSVEDLLRSVVAEHRAAAQLAAAVLRVQVSGRSPLPADEVWLRRALGVLLERAVRVSGAGGEVTVTACGDAVSWTIEVLDTGPDCEHDRLALSGRLVRQHGAERAWTHHLDFELLTARATVQRHGGRIRARTAPAGGTSVHLWLPTAAPR